MDVIEAVVLFDGLRLDAACNSLADPGDLGWVDPEREWKPFQGLRDIRTGHLIFELERFSSDEDVIGGGILATAAERVLQGITDGRMRTQAEKFHDSGMGSAIHRFYAGPANFTELTRRSFEPEAIWSVSADLGYLESVISHQSPGIANFAMFAFRGFYYEELAHLLSISYIPHAFRSSVLAEEGWPTRATFLELALKSVEGLRESYIERLGPLISAQLNSEFGAFDFRAKIPSIATFVAGNADRRSDLLPIALEVRNSASARRFRGWVSKVQMAIDEQARLKVIRDAREELSDLCSDLRRELGILDSKSTEITMKLAAPAGVVGVDIPIKIQARLPYWIQRILHRRSHLKFLRDLALSEIEFAPFELKYQNLQA